MSETPRIDPRRRAVVRDRSWRDLTAVTVFAAIGLAVTVAAAPLGVGVALAEEAGTTAPPGAEAATQLATVAGADAVALPGINAIGPSSSLAAFLKPGVPPELTRAALRKAWLVDPEIHGFVGLSGDAAELDTPPLHASAR